jgi:hypothetical protein
MTPSRSHRRQRPFLINLSAWGANCGRMRKALHEKYDVAQSALAFFDLFADMLSFEQEALGIIQNGLDRTRTTYSPGGAYATKL